VQSITEPRIQTTIGAPVREPIFILAAPHSLSSLLSAALGQHPEVYATPGLHLHGGALVGESIANARNEQPTQIHSLLRTIAHLYSSEQTVESVVMARRWLRRRDRLPSDEVYREICQKAAPRLVIERCPIQTGAATILHSMGTAFPSARFIYLVRHPFAQGKAALSDLQNTKKLIRDHRENNVESPELDPQFAWFETQITIFEFLETIPKERQWHLRVEDLVTEPSTVLSDLCSWLGLAWSSDILRGMLAFENSPFYGPGPFNAPCGYDPILRTLSPWPSLPTEPPLESELPWRKKIGLAPQALELAQALGYGSTPES
jgi:sulfotransferase family protein